MDISEVILCTACLLKVKVTEDILMCAGCRLWYHKACSSGVVESFYREFYLSVIWGDNPRHWKCNYCSKNMSQVKTEPDTDNMTKYNMTAAVSTNILSASEPHSEPDSSDNPFDGFELSQQMQRETGKGHLSLNSSFDKRRSPSRHVSSTAPIQQSRTEADLSRLHNTAYCEDSMLEDVELDITPIALRLPENPKNQSQKELHYSFDMETSTADSNYGISPSRPLSNTYSVDQSSSDSSDSDDEMSQLEAPPTPSTIPYFYSDMSLSSDSEIEFPAPKRVSTAPPSTRDVSLVYCDKEPRSDSSSSSDNEEETMEGRKLDYDTDSDSSDEDDNNLQKWQRSAYRWLSSSESSSDSEDEAAIKQTAPPTFQLISGPVSGGQAALQDSLGYTYTVKFRIGVNTFWCCTEKSTRCQATAIQNRHIITKGAANHNHPARITQAISDKVSPADEHVKPDRFQSLRLDQDKVSGQPPKPQVELINNGTTDEKYILVDSHGYVYYDKEASNEARQTTWRCTKKTKNGTCSGSLRIGENFMVVKAHNHAGDLKKVTELRIKSKIKNCIEGNPSKTPAQIISHILLELGLTRQSLTKPGYQALLKQARKQKQTLKCC